MQREEGNQISIKQSTRRGWLRHGNPPGDLTTAPRCGARTRAKASCKAPAMANGRCRLHGGKSTGPRTEDGRQRCGAINRKHGRYSNKEIAERRQTRYLIRCVRAGRWL
jgi:hypothetical protein